MTYQYQPKKTGKKPTPKVKRGSKFTKKKNRNR